MFGAQQDRNQEATVWVGGLEPQVTEELMWELMLQVGRVGECVRLGKCQAWDHRSLLNRCLLKLCAVSVNMPRDKITNTHQGYAFVEFRTPDDGDYAIKILNGVRLFGKPMRVNKVSLLLSAHARVVVAMPIVLCSSIVDIVVCRFL